MKCWLTVQLDGSWVRRRRAPWCLWPDRQRGQPPDRRDARALLLGRSDLRARFGPSAWCWQVRATTPASQSSLTACMRRTGLVSAQGRKPKGAPGTDTRPEGQWRRLSLCSTGCQDPHSQCGQRSVVCHCPRRPARGSGSPGARTHITVNCVPLQGGAGSATLASMCAAHAYVPCTVQLLCCRPRTHMSAASAAARWRSASLQGVLTCTRTPTSAC